VKNEPSCRSEPTDPLDEILAEYLLTVEQGREPSREELLARHPELAQELGAFFERRDRFRQLAGPLGLLATEPDEGTTDPQQTAPHGSTARPDRDLALPGAFGDYEFLEELGRGAMGVVYRARQRSANRMVAIKMIRGGELASATDAHRFRNEAQIVANLDHPHIVPLYEVGEHDGQPFFSMKLVEGSSLAEQLPRYRADPRAAARLVIQVARAVHHAHQRGVLHRDLKPSNVLIDVEGRPHVGDFGLAKRVEADTGLTQSGAIVGTPSYMAPEQAGSARGAVTTATDVYGLGALLYALLCGRPPFQGPTVLETLLQVRTCEPASPRAVNPQVVRDLETICLKCLRKEPERRYGSAEELAADMERYLAGEPIQGRPVGRTERTWRWCRRNPLAAALTAAVALSLLAGTVIASYFAVQADRRARDQAEARQQADDARAEAYERAGAEAEARRDADAKAKAERRARQDAERQLAVTKVLFAQSEWRENNVERARAVLDEVPPEQRRWEWGYLHRLFEGGHLTLSGHSDPVQAVAFSPDSQRLATGSGIPRSDKPGEVKVWDARTGQELLTLKGHSGPVNSVCFSPDGRRLATGSGVWRKRHPQPVFVGEVKIWDARTGRALLTLEGASGSVCFSPDGRRLATAGGHLAKVWDAVTGKLLLPLKSFPAREVTGVCFSPDGQRLAAVISDLTARVWDAQTGKELLVLKGHKSFLTGVCFSPDGQRLATASGVWNAQKNEWVAGEVKIWEARMDQQLGTPPGNTSGGVIIRGAPRGAPTGQELLTFKGHTGKVIGLCFSPDGQRLATASEDNTAKVWDARTGQQLFTLKGHIEEGVACVCFSPDGQRLVTGGWDNTAKVWDVRAGEEVIALKGHTRYVSSVCFSPDGQRLATASHDQTAKVWKAWTGQMLLAIEGADRVCFSPDGQRLATADGDGTAKVWDARTGQELLSIKERTGGWHVDLCFSPDGQRLATGGRNNTPRVWDVRTGREILTLKGHTGRVECVCYSPNGQRLATGSEDQTVRVWDAGTGDLLLTLQNQTGGVNSVCFSPDSQRLATAASSDHIIRLWDARIGKLLHVLKGHAGPVFSVCFSPDGERLATGGGSGDSSNGYKPGEVRVWDARTGQELLALKDNKAPVFRLSFSPDGGRLAAAIGEFNPGEPGEVKVWYVGRCQEGKQPDADELAFRTAMARLDPFWQEEQAERCEQAGQWFAAAFHLGQLLRARPDDPQVRLRHGLASAELGRWQEAREDFARLVGRRPDEAAAWRGLALTELAMNRPDAYRQTCRQFLQRFEHPPEAAAVGQLFGSPPWNALAAAGLSQVSQANVPSLIAARREVVRACVLQRYALAEPACLLPLTGSDPLLRGAVLCRAGRHDEAVQALTGSKDPIATLFRALAEHGRGNDKAAQQALDEAKRLQTALINTRRPGWDQRFEADLLSKEVTALLHIAKSRPR
jgi:WD40 repeat protein/tRNA A-37 threonylcarbamoyl transferase component Bud32/tetratricopeptide (TPR) repeat protein